MKHYISNILSGVVGISVAAGLWSCTSENPFNTEGEGVVQLRTVVNSITTRAADDDAEAYQQYLNDNCVVYISNKKGLIYKKRGLDNLDSQITLKADSYVAEAWTGDSVTASFDKKFFRGYQPFNVAKGSTSNVVINCRIANVVASINTATIDPNLMRDDYEITIGNSMGKLVFTKENATSQRGYFMMPDNDETLTYEIKGTRKDGGKFTKSGIIPSVERAHHYVLNFEYNPEYPDDPTTGATYIKIHIKTEDLSETSNIEIKARPTITGVDFNIEKQLVFLNDEDIPEQVALQICGFDRLEAVTLRCPSGKLFGVPDIVQDSVNILRATDAALLDKIRNAGIEWAHTINDETKVETVFLTFSKELISKLKPRDKEYFIYVSATDKSKQATYSALRIARSEAAIKIEDPIEIEQVDNNDGLNITSHSVTLTYTLADGIEGTPGVEYSKADEDNWTFVAVSTSQGAARRSPLKAPAKYTVTINGLEEGTTYKYRAACGDFRGDKEMRFETFSKFIIPNSDMEMWAEVSVGGQSGVKVPSRTGSPDFWGNGNPGAKMASTVLTDESTDMWHSPSKSARLESKFASVFGIGKLAAGNLFAGEYVKTDGTDGVLKFGQAFADFADGKKVDVRPTALKLYVNYRPQVAVKKKGADNAYIPEGELDKAQIFVALTTAPVDIRTKASDRKLFNPDDTEVLAYGEKTLESNYGPDGQLQELIIPMEYFERAQGKLPTHLVIVCSASKYGDFFSGGVGSTMYVDDFELIY